MDLGNSKEINDSLEDIRRIYPEVFLKMREADKSNAEPKQCLFPKNKSVKPPIRESMVRRACVKTNVVSSTPMTYAKKQKFTSDRLPSMSPISSETLLKNPNNSRKERTSDSIMFDQPCSSRHDTSSCKELETSRKREYLNTIISKIASNKKQRQDQSQTSFSNSQRKQTKCSRTRLRSMARNLFNSSVVDCGIQTGPSLTTYNTEYNSLEEEEQILINCEKGKKNDTGGSWRISTGLQLYNNLDQDSFLALNISADTDTSDDEFLPKKKVFINEKIGGLPKKEENCRRKSIVSNVPSNKESPKKNNLKSQCQTNDALGSKNKKQNITKTTVSRMVQIERQIESSSSDSEIFNVLKRSVQEKSVYLTKNMEIVRNNNPEVDCSNENIIKAEARRTVLEESCRTEYRSDSVNIENANNIMEPINNLNNTVKMENNSKNEEAYSIGCFTKATNVNSERSKQPIESTLTTNNASVKRKRGRPKKKSDSRNGNSSVKPGPSPKFTQASQDISTETLHQTGCFTKATNVNSERSKQPIETTLTTNNASVKRKRGRPKKKSDSRNGNSSVKPGPSAKFTQASQDISTETLHQTVTKNTQNIPFINLSNDDKLTKSTLVDTTSKLLSPIEETVNENSGCEGLQNTTAVYEYTDKEMPSNIARALNETVEQPATFDTLLNIEDHRHIQTSKCINNPKLKNLTNMDGISIFTLDSGISGLLKIAPKKVKPKQFVLNHDLNFAVIEGHCKVEIQNERHSLSKLGLIFVRQGADYCIENISDTEDLVLYFSKFKH